MRHRLGFLPRGAFEESAGKGELLGAFDEADGALLGYLLFRRVRDQVVIVHLRSGQRGRRISQALIHGLLSAVEHENVSRILLSCRRDYGLDEFWKKLGFTPVAERPGRGRERTILTIWVRRLGGEADLFDWGEEQIDSDRLRVVMDAQVFFRICDEADADYPDEATVLVEDWMTPLIELGYTGELHVEINRSNDEARRRKRREQLTRFKEFVAETPVTNEQAVAALWSACTTARDLSDRDQVLNAAACADVFVTMDEKVLSRSAQIESLCGLQIMRPSALASNLDEASRSHIYEPSRLEGTELSLCSVRTQDIDLLAETFQRSPVGERLSQIRANLRAFAGRGDSVSVRWVKHDGRPLALCVMAKSEPTRWSLELVRCVPSGAGTAALGGLIRRCVLSAIQSGVDVIELAAPHLGAAEIPLLTLAGFLPFSDGVWRRVFLRGFVTPEEAQTQLAGRLPEGVALSPNSGFPSSGTHSWLQAAENCFSPVKINSPEIRNYLIPVRPTWAMSLFDTELSKGELFGGDAYRLLRLENAYYRTADGFKLQAPARILWYVSKGATNPAPPGVTRVRACSLLDEVVIESARVAFRKFKRLGIYRFQNVLECAGGDADSPVMAFSFRNTELLPNPLTPDQLAECGIKPPFPGPREVSGEAFRSIYRLGSGQLEDEPEG